MKFEVCANNQIFNKKKAVPRLELLFDVEEDLAAVGFGTDGEVNPVGSAATFEYQLVKVFMGAVGDVE